MITQRSADGRARYRASDGQRRHVIFEAKSQPVAGKRPRRYRQLLIAAALLASFLMMPRVVYLFAALLIAVLLALVGFILLIQLPMAYVARRLRQYQADKLVDRPAAASATPLERRNG